MVVNSYPSSTIVSANATPIGLRWLLTHILLQQYRLDFLEMRRLRWLLTHILLQRFFNRLYSFR